MSSLIRITLFAILILKAPAALAGSESTEVHAWCETLGQRLHSVAATACHAENFGAGPERTTKGNILAYRDIDSIGHDAGADEPKHILLIGGIHGDELTAVSIVFSWLKWIREPEPASYLWRVIPLANPDGLLAKPSTRVNANGVDLNRNFQTPDWDMDAQTYWNDRTRRDPRRFPGKQAGSEIETQWLEKQVSDFKPDLIISIHAPYNLLDYDGPVPEPTRFGRLTLSRLGVYPGSMGNYSGLYKQIPVITIELPNANNMPAPREQRAMWDDMLNWMKNNIKPTLMAPLPAGKSASTFGHATPASATAKQ